MNLPVTQKHFLSFSRKLFLSVISLFLVFAACFMAYQYQREKEYKVELLNIQLQDCNNLLYEKLYDHPQDMTEVISDYLQHNVLKDLRITVVNLDGKVLFDSQEQNVEQLGNHLDREEVQKALYNGVGFDVRRTSETTGVPYFYSATLYKDYIIRSALPYSVSLINNLKADPHYIWFTVIVTLLLMIIFYKFTNKLGTSISQLREFAMRADRNEPIEMAMQSAFPHNELGEISQHIIQIYKRLHETKEALYIEREKLITHLQISHEGLGVFNKDKKEILVNNLFTQYSNLISDSNLETAEEVFNISELKEITDFINKAPKRPVGKEEKRMSITINKNGKTFIVECIIFQDMSFEISINDVTQEEEQIRLKRQLTQNIAHELKTPVSSIRGYIETILEQEHLEPVKQKFFLERAYIQILRLSELIRDVALITKTEEASDLFEKETINIRTTIDEVTTDLEVSLQHNHIVVHNHIGPKVEIEGNHTLLYSIFRNLIDNAINYAGENITIGIDNYMEDSEFYYFSFYDTGRGIEEEHLERIFDRFYRVNQGRSRKTGGSGLGLSIVKNAVLFHKGQITAKNRKDGGLEFIFSLRKKLF